MILNRIFSIGTLTFLQALNTALMYIQFGVGSDLDQYIYLSTLPMVIIGVTILPANPFWLQKFSKPSVNLTSYLIWCIIIYILGAVVLAGVAYWLLEESNLVNLFVVIYLLQATFFLQYPLYHSAEKFFELENFTSISLVLSASLLLIILMTKVHVTLELMLYVLTARFTLAMGLAVYFMPYKNRCLKKLDIQYIICDIRKSTAVAASGSISRFEGLLDRTVLLSFGEGMLATFYAVQQVYSLIIGITSKIYVAPLIPKILEIMSRSEIRLFENMRNRIERMVILIFTFTVPFTLLGTSFYLNYDTSILTASDMLITLLATFAIYSYSGLLKDPYVTYAVRLNQTPQIIKYEIVYSVASYTLKILALNFTSFIFLSISFVLPPIYRIIQLRRLHAKICN